MALAPSPAPAVIRALAELPSDALGHVSLVHKPAAVRAVLFCFFFEGTTSRKTQITDACMRAFMVDPTLHSTRFQGAASLHISNAGIIHLPTAVPVSVHPEPAQTMPSHCVVGYLFLLAHESNYAWVD